MARQQLPPGIKKIELEGRENGRPKVRYIVTVDVAPPGAPRDQKQKRFKTEAEARKWQSDTQSQVRSGQYVRSMKLTVEQACAEWLKSKHALEEGSVNGYEIWLRPLRKWYGDLELQQLSKAHLDEAVRRLRAGGDWRKTPWAARTVNGMLQAITAVLDDRMKQGHIIRNVGHLIDRLPDETEERKTYGEDDMYRVLRYPDRDQHLWALALCMGLRRSEIAGLRWKYVDFEARTLEIAEVRVVVKRKIIIKKPKTKRSARTLPIPDEVYVLLKDAHDRVESDYVACGRDGSEYHPNYVWERWNQMIKLVGVEYITLHDARHTCASYMHYRGVRTSVMSKYLGHSTNAFTMNRYVHSKDEELNEASAVFGRSND